MTERLYENAPFLRRFSARVLACTQEKGGWAAVLDRTAFYPEGGGQPGDRGLLGSVTVTDTRNRGDEVVHLCDGPLDPGAEVEGELDWARRFDHMQQHSGEHIVSGLICARYGCDNVGFHLGEEAVVIDFNRPIPPEDLPDIERAANAVIWEDRPFLVTHPDPAELAALPYRSKKALAGDVRIVTVPGADCCACCGTHVRSAGAIGLIRLLSLKPFREGVRIELLAGGRAYDYCAAVAAQNHAVSVLLSAPERKTAAAAERLKQELAETKYRLVGAENRLFDLLAARYAGRDFALLREPDLSPDGLRRLCERIGAACPAGAAVFSGADGTGWRYAVKLPPDALRRMNAALRGRGGGKGGFAQGSVAADWAEIAAFFAEETVSNKTT